MQVAAAPDARAQWAAEMRLKLSPPAMLEADGSIRQGYFKPKHVRPFAPPCQLERCVPCAMSKCEQRMTACTHAHTLRNLSL